MMTAPEWHIKQVFAQMWGLIIPTAGIRTRAPAAVLAMGKGDPECVRLFLLVRLVGLPLRCTGADRGAAN